MISDNNDKGNVVRFPTPAGKMTADECRQKARDLMLQADGTESVSDKARLLREAASWLEKAKALEG